MLLIGAYIFGLIMYTDGKHFLISTYDDDVKYGVNNNIGSKGYKDYHGCAETPGVTQTPDPEKVMIDYDPSLGRLGVGRG